MVKIERLQHVEAAASVFAARERALLFLTSNTRARVTTVVDKRYWLELFFVARPSLRTFFYRIEKLFYITIFNHTVR